MLMPRCRVDGRNRHLFKAGCRMVRPRVNATAVTTPLPLLAIALALTCTAFVAVAAPSPSHVCSSEAACRSSPTATSTATPTVAFASASALAPLRQAHTHGRFPYRGISSAPSGAWPGGRRLAVYVKVSVEDFPFGSAGPSWTVPLPLPDVLNYG